MTDDKLPLAMFVDSPEFPFPPGSAPGVLVRHLAELVPDWQVEPPDGEGPDIFVSAMAPDGSGRGVAVIADWPDAGGYRAHEEWGVTSSGGIVAVEVVLTHAAGWREFAAAVRAFRAVEALPLGG